MFKPSILNLLASFLTQNSWIIRFEEKKVVPNSENPIVVNSCLDNEIIGFDFTEKSLHAYFTEKNKLLV